MLKYASKDVSKLQSYGRKDKSKLPTYTCLDATLLKHVEFYFQYDELPQWVIKYLSDTRDEVAHRALVVN